MHKPASVLITPTPRLSKLRKWSEGWLFASPFILGFVLFWAGPMLFSLFIVTQNWNLLSPPKFIGAANILNLLKDPVLPKSLYATAIYTFISVPLQIVFALLLALALNA